MTVTDEQTTTQAPAAQPNTRELAQKLGTLEALAAVVKAELDQARAEAAPILKAAAMQAGATAIGIEAPGYGPVGKVNIKAGEVRTAIDPEALELLAMECDGMEDYFDPAALDRPDVQAYIRLAHPGLVERVVADVFRAHVSGNLQPDGTYVVEKTGEAVKVARVWREEPTGAFAFSWTKPTKTLPGGKHLIAQAWRDARAAAGQTGELWQLDANTGAGEGNDTVSA